MSASASRRRYSRCPRSIRSISAPASSRFAGSRSKPKSVAGSVSPSSSGQSESGRPSAAPRFDDAAAGRGVALRIEVDQQHALADSARQAERLTAVVVLPTPPFWLVTASILAKSTPPSMPRLAAAHHYQMPLAGDARHVQTMHRIHHHINRQICHLVLVAEAFHGQPMTVRLCNKGRDSVTSSARSAKARALITANLAGGLYASTRPQCTAIFARPSSIATCCRKAVFFELLSSRTPAGPDGRWPAGCRACRRRCPRRAASPPRQRAGRQRIEQVMTDRQRRIVQAGQPIGPVPLVEQGQ
jgi:hypothetical protein